MNVQFKLVQAMVPRTSVGDAGTRVLFLLARDLNMDAHIVPGAVHSRPTAKKICTIWPVSWTVKQRLRKKPGLF